MSEWFTVPQTSEKTGIPQQTLRRYIASHAHLLRIKKEHKAYQLHKECLDVLARIRELYGKGKNSEEVDKILASEGVPITVEVVSETGEQESTDLSEVMMDIKQALDEQKEFNKQLLDKFKEQEELLVAQQKYIDEKLKQRDEQLMLSMREIQEAKLLASPTKEDITTEEKKDSWFIRLFKK
ncbi:hypothetical protein COI96_00040 [Priestia megaterium]|uniref:DUF3967 domain-containing protein n=1 Tax=Priestia megaterium TaxID=1404 RepID=UPI000BF4D192|nr:DUF3967 domain-containing protein [Priestia megaterium]PFK03453.1 hypothetical protein COI96_00040 [Priestia megaterium]